jgi:adenosine kinase
MKVLVTGSLAFDYIMTFPGYFKDHIIPDKAHIINLSFLVSNMRYLRGGCAANIAYSLALLEVPTVIAATAGHDFEEYRRWLEAHGIDTSGVTIIDSERTATCFITTDLSDNQLTGFYPGAMAYAWQISLHSFSKDSIALSVISPNDPRAMVKHALECQDLGVPFLFDPGQQSIALDPRDIERAARGARIMAGNDYEFEVLRQRTGRSPADWTELAELVAVTKGDQGSVIYARDGRYTIPPARARQVVDPTGAGDAYRAGIIKGLLSGMSVPDMGRLASVVAVWVVEHEGTMNHRFTLEQVADRFFENFGYIPKELEL